MGGYSLTGLSIYAASVLFGVGNNFSSNENFQGDQSVKPNQAREA
jgi:hypothetical protein